MSHMIYEYGGVLLPDFTGKEARHCSDLSPWIFREGRSEALRGGDPRG